MSSRSSRLAVRIRCDSMDLAADIVQDLARFFNITELESEADFPLELQQFEEVGSCLYLLLLFFSICCVTLCVFMLEYDLMVSWLM